MIERTQKVNTSQSMNVVLASTSRCHGIRRACLAASRRATSCKRAFCLLECQSSFFTALSIGTRWVKNWAGCGITQNTPVLLVVQPSRSRSARPSRFKWGSATKRLKLMRPQPSLHCARVVRRTRGLGVRSPKKHQHRFWTEIGAYSVPDHITGDLAKLKVALSVGPLTIVTHARRRLWWAF